ncbi:hypothetical protein [Streptomyces sp. SAS_270]|uniref:hypothetical protein n=1 Tax=Streptomyces sp. SAS_270 TaxID=3412748 RepID=UPI00403C8CC4
MADEHYRWLDRDAAERLLNGEPLEDVDADLRAEADRLSRALHALAAEPALSSAELPGEAAALAAFRKVQEGQAGPDGEAVQVGRGRGRAHGADVGLVRLGRPAQDGRRARWGRPARLGLAAALAAGMLGGVAVAAGTGVLRTPFGDDRPGPVASVTAAVTPDRPLVSPPPGGDRREGLQAPTPGGKNSPSGGTSSHDPSKDGSGEGPGNGASARPGSDSSGRWDASRYGGGASGLLSSCRDLRAGKTLESGRRRALEGAAGGGGTRVKNFCKDAVTDADARTHDDDKGDRGDKGGKGAKGSGRGSGKGSGKGSHGGSGSGGRGDQDDQGDRGGDADGHIRGGHGHSGGDRRGGGNGHRGSGGTVISAPVSPHPTPSPMPSRSAL